MDLKNLQNNYVRKIEDPEEYSKKLQELMSVVPTGLSLQIAYNPLIMIVIIMDVCNDMIDQLADNRINESKVCSRKLRNIIKEKRTQYFSVLPIEVKESILNFANEYHSWFANDLQKYYFSYTNSIINEKSFKLDSDVAYIIAWSYVILDICDIILKFDRESYNTLKNYAKNLNIEYSPNEDEFCIDVRKILNEFLQSIGLKTKYDNYNIEIARKIFDKHIHSITYQSEDGTDYNY